jgi:hypothetical protein
MSLLAKFATVFLCAAICGLSVSLIPSPEQSKQRHNQTTPVLLRESQRVHWLLV